MLVAFLPIFSQPDFQAIKEWIVENPDGTLCLPHPIYNPSVEHFFDNLANNQCWLDCHYIPIEAKNKIENIESINNASLSEIKTMLSYVFRGERFVDGFWGSAFSKGQICSILKRLQQIQDKS